jgi:hypothetical protein
MQYPVQDGKRTENNPDTNEDVASFVRGFDFLDLLHSIDLGEAYLRLFDLAVLFMTQDETGIGDLADPTLALGAVQELDFHRTIQDNRRRLFLGRGTAGWLPFSETIGA